MSVVQWTQGLGFLTVLCPALLLMLFGFRLLVNRPMSELILGRWLKASVGVSLISALAVL